MLAQDTLVTFTTTNYTFMEESLNTNTLVVSSSLICVFFIHFFYPFSLVTNEWIKPKFSHENLIPRGAHSASIINNSLYSLSKDLTKLSLWWTHSY
jgi:hypothetical protein